MHVNGRQLAAAHGSADVRVIDGIGHQIPLEDARGTTQILTAFISACFARASRTGQPSPRVRAADFAPAADG
jgi:hypothetical protein